MPELPDVEAYRRFFVRHAAGQTVRSVVVTDPNVSRRHAEVRREDGAIVVVDLDSTNGTRVNGHGVKHHVLDDGDEITVGNTALRFEAS